MNKSTNPASDEIWSLIKETQKNLKEVSVSHKEAKQEMKELRASHKEAKQEMKELRASQKETEKQIKALFAETSLQMKETDRQIQKIGGRFNERWGALVESLVEGNLVELLQSRGIDIMQTHTRSTAQWKKSESDIQKREFDIIVTNGTEVVVVEVKTTLNPMDVKNFLETLRDFKNYFPRYKSETVYGAIAYLTSENKAHFLAEEQGLFIIRATGDSASIVNEKDFKPRVFS